MIKVKNAKFITSASRITQAPPPILSEVVFMGRSNVGKSTLINTILDSNLAKNSSTPGKTRLINFFETCWEDMQTNQNLTFNIIDLPGIGYAKVSKAEMEQWKKSLWEFITKRSNIKLFIHLIDSRHLGLEIDENLYNVLESFLRNDQNILRVFTKADKLKKNELAKLYQKNGVIMGNKEGEIRPQNGGKNTLRAHIFQAILHTQSPLQNLSQNNLQQSHLQNDSQKKLQDLHQDLPQNKPQIKSQKNSAQEELQNLLCSSLSLS